MRALTLAAATLAAVASVATAASTHGMMRATPNPVRAGHLLTISGSANGCPVGDAVTIVSKAFVHTHEFAGVPAVYAKVRTGGSFRTTTTIPRGRRAGTYGITARCGGGNLGVAVHLRVTR